MIPATQRPGAADEPVIRWNREKGYAEASRALTYVEARAALLAGEKHLQSQPVRGWTATNPNPTVRGIRIGSRLYAMCCPRCGAAWHQHGGDENDVIGSRAHVASHCLTPDGGGYYIQVLEVYP